MNIALFAILLGIASAEFPSNFKKCNRKDANFKDCIIEAAADGIQQLIKPFPMLNIPNAEPLEITELTISPGSKGVVAVEQKFKNCKVFGITKAKIRDFEIQFDAKELVFEAILPDLKLKCDYELDGKVTALSIKGKGPATIDIDNGNLSFHAYWDESKRADGQTAIKFVKQTLTINPEKLELNFENLFNGDKTLGDQINKVLNDNWQVVWEDVKDGYQKAIGVILVELANDFFSTLSLEEAVD